MKTFFLKKYKLAPPTILPTSSLALYFTQCIEMLKNLLRLSSQSFMGNSIFKPLQWSVRNGFLANWVADQYKFGVSPALRCAGFERFCADTDTDCCCLTLFAFGGGTVCPHHHSNCPQIAEKRKISFKKSTNLTHPPSSPLPPLALHFTQCIEMLKNLLRLSSQSIMGNSISKPPQWSLRIGFLAYRVADQ